MGMPVIEPGDTTCEQVVTNLIESVAMQENALAHILNAEGEKMQAILDMDNITTQQLLKMNKSAERMVTTITRLEMLLEAKVDLVGDFGCGTTGVTGGEVAYGCCIR